jgi:hypothetical protein
MASALGRCRVPLVFYYLVTVLVPLANGSGDTSRGFLEHIAFVLAAPPTLIMLFALAAHAWRKVAMTNGAPASNQRSA